MRLVFAVGGTRFGALDFTADGTTLLYAAVHGDDAPLLHAIDLTDPTINQGLWHGDPGDRISSIATQPDPDGDLIALTVGATCEDSRAMVFRRGEQPQPLADAPSRIVGWLDGSTVLVATDGCDGPSNLVAIDSGQPAAVPLVTGIEIAAARTPLLRLRSAAPGRDRGGGRQRRRVMNAMAAGRPPETKAQPDGRRKRSNQACVRIDRVERVGSFQRDVTLPRDRRRARSRRPPRRSRGTALRLGRPACIDPRLPG